LLTPFAAFAGDFDTEIQCHQRLGATKIGSLGVQKVREEGPSRYVSADKAAPLLWAADDEQNPKQVYVFHAGGAEIFDTGTGKIIGKEQKSDAAKLRKIYSFQIGGVPYGFEAANEYVKRDRPEFGVFPQQKRPLAEAWSSARPESRTYTFMAHNSEVFNARKGSVINSYKVETEKASLDSSRRVLGTLFDRELGRIRAREIDQIEYSGNGFLKKPFLSDPTKEPTLKTRVMYEEEASVRSDDFLREINELRETIAWCLANVQSENVKQVLARHLQEIDGRLLVLGKQMGVSGEAIVSAAKSGVPHQKAELVEEESPD
jgi:hypothetical protein